MSIRLTDPRDFEHFLVDLGLRTDIEVSEFTGVHRNLIGKWRKGKDVPVRVAHAILGAVVPSEKSAAV